MMRSFFVIVMCAVVSCCFGQSYFDDFNDNSVDVLKWSADIASGGGEMEEVNQRVEYSVEEPAEEFDEVLRPFAERVPTDQDWEAIIETGITLTPSVRGHNVSIGLDLRNPDNDDQKLYVEQYTGMEFEGVFRGFLSDMRNTETEGLTGNLGVTQGAVRLFFESSTKVITASYSTGGSPGVTNWQTLAKWGLGGSGGTTANQDWGLAATDTLQLSIEAFSEFLPIEPGTVWVDEFRVTIFDKRPVLSITRQGESIIIAWTSSDSEFSLQSTTALGGIWETLDVEPSVTGNNYEVTTPLGELAAFFRLIKQP